jgi:hypothetical protein
MPASGSISFHHPVVKLDSIIRREGPWRSRLGQCTIIIIIIIIIIIQLTGED